jgi:hypothetical protein
MMRRAGPATATHEKDATSAPAAELRDVSTSVRQSNDIARNKTAPKAHSESCNSTATLPTHSPKTSQSPIAIQSEPFPSGFENL